MSTIRQLSARFVHEQSGHLWRLITAVLGAAGAIVLAVGATGNNDALVWIGAVVVALAFLNGGFLEHTKMDYPTYARLDKLEGGH